MNTPANNTVNNKPYKDPFLSPFIKEWWAYVTVIPEDSNNTVFNKGNSKGFIDCIPKGGHFAPNSIVGDNALWKNAQKIAKKNNASDTINNPIPMFIPLWTANVWLPKYVPSDIISLNQRLILRIKLIRPADNIYKVPGKLWNKSTALRVIVNKAIQV